MLGMLLTNRPLKEKEIFEVKLDRLNNRWTSSLMIGALFESPEKLHLPVTALGLKKNAIVISGETLFQNGHKMPETTLGRYVFLIIREIVLTKKIWNLMAFFFLL